MIMLKIGIIGYSGKLGQKIKEILLQEPKSYYICNTQAHSHKEIDLLAQKADVLIDVSHPCLLPAILSAAKNATTPLVIGTTGYNASEKESLLSAAEHIPLLHATNFSCGITLIHLLLQKLALCFGEDSDINIVEAHHKHKKDAPSGTALSLYDTLKKHLPQKDIAFHSMRAGSIVGEHSILFTTEEEEIAITHKVQSRLCFAKGAIKAASFIHNKEKGIYSMFDVLKEKELCNYERC